MPAETTDLAMAQIQHFKNVASRVVSVQNLIFQLLEHEEVVTQIWNNLETDHPTIVEAGGNIVGETFNPSHITQCKNKLVDLSDYFQGTSITVTGNPGRNIRRLTSGVIY